MGITQARDVAKVVLTRSPAAHRALRRAYALGRYGARRAHDQGYAVFGLFQRDGVFLDVGANAGMSAMSFRLYNRAPIISIEPNPFHQRDLRFTGRIVRRHSYRMYGAGSRDQEMELHVPVYRGVPLTAEASLLREQVAASWGLQRQLGARMSTPEFRIVTVHVAVRRLDGLGLRPAYVKVDVQGYEYEALVGMHETLALCKPMLLIETPDERVRSLLDELGYRPFRFETRSRRLLATDSFESGDTVFLAD